MKVPDFKKIAKFDRAFWTTLGKKTVIQHKTHVQVDGRGAEGKLLGNYSLNTLNFTKSKKVLEHILIKDQEW